MRTGGIARKLSERNGKMMNQTQKHTTGKKLLALLLALVMMLSLLPTSVLATGSKPTVVIAGSDFQNSSGDTAGAQTVTNILTQMQSAGYMSADGFLFCGDYNHSYDTTAAGLQGHIDVLDAAVSEKYSSIAAGNRVYVQGNHDQVTAGTGGLAKSGANDPTGDSAGKYGVFVINEDDYMWASNANNSSTTYTGMSAEAIVKQTAARLESYLSEKKDAGFTAPIFVLSHLPLHYSMRTRNDGDGMYANYIFDVLNAAGANGLNIIFLYGHDHSNGWDDYLGGSCVYLAKGKNINIAQESKTNFQTETLNFTYMNAGYTGYYSAVNSGAETTLTMTVFSITGNTVTVERYDANGKHNLKSAGVTNSSKNEGRYYDPNTTVYGSPQTIALTAVTPLVTKTDGNVSVTAPGLTGLTATKKDVTFDTSVYSAYVSYDITPAGYTKGNNATVKITLDKNDGFDTSRKVTVIDKDGGNTEQTVSIANGTVTFTTNHFSTYDIAQEALAEPTERTYTRVTSLDELVSGSQYLLIVNEGTDYFMLPESVSKESGTRVGFKIEATTAAGGNTITGDYSAKEWTITASGSEWILSAASGDAYFANTDGTRAQAVFSTTNNTKFTIAGSADNFTFKSGNYAFDHSSAGVINGYNKNPSTKFYIYRLTSTGTVDPSGGDWVTISDGQGKTIFRLVNSLNSGKKYLIVNSGSAGSANAVNLNGKDINSASVTIIADSEGNYIEAPANTAQWTYTSAGKFQNVSSTGIYLRGGKNAGDYLITTKDSDDKRTTWQYDANNGLSETSKSRYISSSFKMLSSGSSSDRVYIYEEATLQASAEYAKLTGSLTYTVTPGASTEDALDAVKAGIDVVTSSDKTNETTLPDDNNSIKWTLDSSYRGEAGEYAVTISYKNTVIGIAKVIVPALTVTNIAVAPMDGTVRKGASNYAKTGSKLTVTYSDGSTRTVDVTLGMLSGDFDKNTVGDYTGLTVTYGGKTVTDYTLHVIAKEEYPTFPNEGSVRVGKTASATNFPGTGVAKVELTATGVPVKKGADVIVMVDTSSSMNTTVSGSSKSRIQVLRESLVTMMRQLKAVGADGEPQDIRVAVADFNGYTDDSNSRYYQADEDHLSGASIRGRGTHIGLVYTGSRALNAEAFVDVNSLSDTAFNSIETYSGTNYDYAFDAVYQLGEAILKQNAQDEEERDLFVIFMSDGAPFQYNYFSSNSNTANWNNWLQGTVTASMWDNNAHNYFYNGSGNKHRMAEAIKGNPDEMYTVIRKDSTDNYGEQQYMTQLRGLGATMYSIGFCLADDSAITVASMEHVLRQIASSEDYYYTATNASQLDDAFRRITSAIKYAATNARFVDTMGANYNLQMANTVGSGITLETAPTITVTDYAIYKTSDVGNYVGGKLVTADMVGKRTGLSTTLEMVRFNDAGTQAFSDKIGGGATNILKGGVICAKTFWYNTTGSAVSIDTDGDGTNDYNLAPETFYWKMGTIGESELALSYYVYLDGSMEGTREAGSYPTNESAVLYYTNYLDHEAHKDTVSPRMPWKAAHVNYAFYLVDQNGNVITDMTAGTTGTFANKIALTNPTLFGEVLLNNNETVQSSVVAKNVLPVGYELYNDDAQYDINIHSGAGSNWVITDTSQTTYVTDYNGNDYTNETNVSDSSYDYTHTTVWFAVKYVSKPINDTVVVDFGLPVDISVLSNDMLPAGAVVSAISHDESTIASTTCTGTYGTLSINQGGKSVRYEMNVDNGMQMQPEVFYYATTNSSYSATLTIIPATTVYYEDSFVTTNDSSAADETYGVWTPDGTTDSKTQAEDRPGTASVLADANNLYGYDAAYANFKQFSLGSAKKVTVNAATGTPNTAPTASFTFTGTGFDIISLTDNTSGTIVVTVKNRETNETKNYSVNNYFGYTYSDGDGTWTPTNSADPNALYQVPVIKVEDLTYGTYDVTIKVAYLKSLDQHDTGECSFWLDAVRIYDPAKNDETANNAYSADKESGPDYAEVRNLLIDGNAFAVDGASVTGAVFIDGISSGATIKQFTEFGPNNEAYLANNQAIAFQLVANNVPESVQLGAKLAVGDSATLYFNDKEFKTLSTATDMYYALSGLNWTKDETNGIYTSDVVVLQHKGGDGIISLTNIKITGGAEFIETSADPLNEVKLAKEPVVMALASPQMAARALKMVAVYEEPAPEIISVVADSAEVMVGDTVKLTVTTNADTDYILVNAAAVETYTEDEAGNRVWTYEAKAEEPGEVSFTVTAMSADGHESEESTCTVDVQQPAKPANDIAAMVKKAMNAFRKIFDAIFGWRR